MSYTIVAYKEIGENDPHYTFGAKNKRQVVGLMKTIMDNFNPEHVDVMRDPDEKLSKNSKAKGAWVNGQELPKKD